MKGGGGGSLLSHSLVLIDYPPRLAGVGAAVIWRALITDCITLRYITLHTGTDQTRITSLARET